VTKFEPELTVDRPIEIGLVCFPGVQATTVRGLTNLFTYAGHFALDLVANPQPPLRAGCPAQPRRRQPRLRIRHWQQQPAGDTLECTFDSHDGPAGKPAVVIVPASQRAPMEQGCAPASVEWVKARHSEGAIVAAVCGGVFLLAETGLLAGRRATTHWMFAEELARRFPDILIEPDRLMIDDGDTITAGAVLAWANLGLCLVERLLGARHDACHGPLHAARSIGQGPEKDLQANRGPISCRISPSV
jgi:transcriptional regulator GlxA family with amidase domain